MSDLFGFFRRPRTVAVVLGLCYLAVGWLWIGFSDQLGRVLFTSPESLTQFQTYKGIGFVAASALLLYAALAAGRPEPEAVPSPDGSRSLSVRMMLTVLVLATALPMACLLGWNVSRETRVQLDAANALIARVASDEAAELQVFLQSQLRVAATIAQRDSVRLLEDAQCDPLLAELPLLDAAVREVLTVNAEGRIVCWRHDSSGPGAVRAAPAWLPALLKDGLPVIGNPVQDADGVWTFTVAQPIMGADGKPAGAVQINVPVAVLLSIIEGPLPEGGSITVVDARAKVLARLPSGLTHTGSPLRDGLTTAERARDGQSYTTVGLDGVERLYASRNIGTTGWIAIAGVPVDNIYGPARQAFLRSALAALAILFACGWLVVLVSRRIVAPMRGLEDAAQGVAAGHFNQRAPESGPSELVAVATAFNQMLDRLPALERALRESEVRHRTLIEKLSSHAPGVIYEFVRMPDGSSTMPFASEHIREMFQLTPAEVKKEPRQWLDRIHPDDRTRLLDDMATSMRDLSYVSAEYRVVLPGREVRHYLSQSQPERRPDGATVWYGCAMDITQLKNAQSALSEANDSLEHRIADRTAALAAANEALGAFSYSVAHDLRGPLQVIDGFSRLLGKSMREGDTQRAHSYNERIIGSAARMNDLIDGFLELARTGRAPLDERALDVAALVQAVLHEQPHAARAEITVGPLPRVAGDASLLRQVWTNLLSNALKYSGRRAQPRIDIGCEMSEDEVVFRVRDNGAGFDVAYASKLFSPFHRLHKFEEFEGTGVGLALVRRIVESHGGRVWADAQVDVGATFFFALPAARLIRDDEAALAA